MKCLISLAILCLAVAVQASPAKHHYRCYSKNTNVEVVALMLQGRSATLDGDKGRLDPSYQGGASDTYVRFIDFQPLDGEIELLVEKKLRAGASRGRIRLQVRGEGFSSDLYQCYSRD